MDWIGSWIRSARREVPRALGRFRRLSLWSVLHDVVRAAQLNWQNPPLRPMPSRAERLVVTLTTVPPRIHDLTIVLRSLVDQSCPADRVVLAWPSWSNRLGVRYPDPPPLPPGIDILACRDLGPATKLLPALLAEPDAAIVVVDDDVIYPVDFLANLLVAHRRFPRAAVGLRGCRFRPGLTPCELPHIFGTALAAPADVDILMGTWGYLLPPGALDGAVHDFDDWPEEVRWVDDFWVSGHLARRGVRRLVVPARGLPLETSSSRRFALDRGPNRPGINDLAAIKAFANWW